MKICEKLSERGSTVPGSEDSGDSIIRFIPSERCILSYYFMFVAVPSTSASVSVLQPAGLNAEYQIFELAPLAITSTSNKHCQPRQVTIVKCMKHNARRYNALTLRNYQ